MLFRVFLVGRFPGAQSWLQDGTNCIKLAPQLAQNWHKLDHVSDTIPQIGSKLPLSWPNIGANEPKLQEERPNMAPTCFQYSLSLHQDGSSTAQIGPNMASSGLKSARILAKMGSIPLQLRLSWP